MRYNLCFNVYSGYINLNDVTTSFSMFILEQIEGIKLCNINIKVSQSVLYSILVITS